MVPLKSGWKRSNYPFSPVRSRCPDYPPLTDRDGQNFQVFFPTKWRFDSKCVACLLVGALEWLQTVEPTTGGGGPASEIAIVIITGLERKQCFAKNDLLRSPDRKTLSVALVADLTPPLGGFLLLA